MLEAYKNKLNCLSPALSRCRAYYILALSIVVFTVLDTRVHLVKLMGHGFRQHTVFYIQAILQLLGKYAEP